MTDTSPQTAGNTDGTTPAVRPTPAGLTLALLVLLDVGRAKVGHRKVLPTIAQTVGIATAAAIAGLLVGKLIS